MQWDILRPAERAAPPSDLRARGDAGKAFEASVFSKLLQANGNVVHVAGDRTRPDAWVAATMAAIDDGCGLILGGRLPIDEVGRRVAEPDVLVRTGDAPVDGRWRYRPVDVKNHSMLVGGKGADVVVHALEHLGADADPSIMAASAIGNRETDKAKKDLLQLAHYHRSLDACGHAAPGDVWAGVLGSEEQVVWYRLDLPMWQTPAKSDGRKRKKRTTLEVYDFEFAFRLDIAAVAEQHRDDASVPLLIAPVQIGECDSCPWREHCGEILRVRQDVSLLPDVGWKRWKPLRAAGLDTMPAVAAWGPGTPVDGISEAVLARVADDARARLGPELAYRRRGVDKVVVPRADIEVDVDMENAAEVYLWGTWTTDRVGAGLVPPGYEPFADWSYELTEAGALALFERFLNWLQELRGSCRERGLTFAAYCWSGGGAENKWLRKYGALSDRADEVEQLIASDEWIDLERVWDDQLITGDGTSVKTVAKLLDFKWSDEDPGGSQSMFWYAEATDPARREPDRRASRDRLIAYNKDDVKATLVVRGWLEEAAPFSSVDGLL